MNAIKSKYKRNILLASCINALLFINFIYALPNNAVGYERMMLGDFEVIALYDGVVELHGQFFKGSYEDNLENNPEDKLSNLSERSLSNPEYETQTSVNTYLINTGENIILVDAGVNQCKGTNSGHLDENLRASGYLPEQIDIVLLTHLHVNHICGLVNLDKMAFPNANVYVSQIDADFWLSYEQAAQALPQDQINFKIASDSVKPYRATDQLKFFKGPNLPIFGVKAIATPGHTNGHSAYLFESKGESLIVWGSIIHSIALQLNNPDISVESDMDPAQGIITRKLLLKEISNNRSWVAGAHIPFPGIGRIYKDIPNEMYYWIPLEYKK
ncbi:MBL fold metallo-hydrolase [Gammaproteobacteria bacterium]|nr:MBL fold metallo-hydrolase [Gammaproteobacteria bacterium]